MSNVATPVVTPAKKREVSLEEFVTVNTKMAIDGKSVKDIADALGLDRDYVAQRRTLMRKQGIPLPTLSKGGGRTASNNVEEAQKLLAKLTGKNLDDIKNQGAALVKAAAERAAKKDSE